MTTLITCKKDEDSDSDELRVYKVKIYWNDVNTEIWDITYSSERVILIDKEFPPNFGYPASYAKTEVTYPVPDSIVIRDYILESYGWAYQSMELLRLKDGLIVSQSYAYGGHESIRRVFEYQYSGGILTESLESVYGNPVNKTIFEYEGADEIHRLRFSYDEDWILSGLDTSYYSGDKIDSLIGFSVENEIRKFDHKIEYFHEGEKITEARNFYYDSTSWKYRSTNYWRYSPSGMLNSESLSIGGDVYKTEYFYEEGQGNYWLIATDPKY